MPLTDEITPSKLVEAVQRGHKRLATFRKSRLHFIREYVGSYYDTFEGTVGSNALNLIFNAVRVLVPTMVMNFPKHAIETPYLQARQYAKLLGLALDQHDKKIDIRDVYRRVIVDAIFTMGIMKTGLAQSDDVHVFDDAMGQETLDNGTVYTEAVDWDNFVVDPNSKEYLFRDATFMGDRIIVPRQMLLDSGQYNNDLVMQLPREGDDMRESKASSISMRTIDIDDNYAMMDEVALYEIWVPSANAIVTISGDPETKQSDYLRVSDYYGVKEGPYTFLTLTPPVPGNPLPVPMVGIWFDLHVLANRMAKKIAEQAERQKDITVYKPSASDDAQQLRDAGDGDAIKVDDPSAVEVKSFGGQQNSNVNHLASLEGWFNMMAGNPAQVGGMNIESKSATAANILQQNAGVGLEDMKDMVYIAAASEARKRAWYFHTDPLMRMPLVQRQMQQQMVPVNGQWLQMPTMQDVQVILTPEARDGDFLDYAFTIQPESMGRVDAKVRLQQEMAFAQQVLPAVMAAAQIAMSLGMPFNATAFLIRIAGDMQITWLDEVLYDPNFQMQMMQQMMMGPQADQSKGQIAPPQNPGLMPSIMQNGQPANGVQGAPPSPQMQQNQGAQAGANDGQMEIKSALRSAFRPNPNAFSGLS